MGSWGTKIKDNDTFVSIYQTFFDLYNEGEDPVKISKQIQQDFFELFDDEDDRNSSYFALALAQWETQSLQPKIFKKVKKIIDSGEDIKLMKEQGVQEKALKQRQKELNKFLLQLSTERESPKRRIKPKVEFTTGELLRITAPDNLKQFYVQELYTNGKYNHTVGMMMWQNGGGSVFYYTEPGRQVSAKWMDSQKLEITHDKDIAFQKQEHSFYFIGDEVAIVYIAR